MLPGRRTILLGSFFQRELMIGGVSRVSSHCLKHQTPQQFGRASRSLDLLCHPRGPTCRVQICTKSAGASGSRVSNVVVLSSFRNLPALICEIAAVPSRCTQYSIVQEFSQDHVHFPANIFFRIEADWFLLFFVVDILNSTNGVSAAVWFRIVVDLNLPTCLRALPVRSNFGLDLNMLFPQN